ncbi:hypothetical protein [Saccharopolyspora phatthalungensis]|uniref:Uncharacterized protein n=1 Tax=Saccharopolyspora phatthalungensis TaxID=664693 RepID=A0A840Q2H9_9PSEU|nr:hypothetical protein [Saccharopolyspora phatthalungensis]MBB5152929.1 hypothetical protein [Saccharopolyspora phatthalungensis]
MADPLVGQVDDKLQELDRKIKEFFGKVNEVLSWVPETFAHLIEPIQRGMAVVGQKIQEFWDRVQQAWNQPGNSAILSLDPPVLFIGDLERLVPSARSIVPAQEGISPSYGRTVTQNHRWIEAKDQRGDVGERGRQSHR